MLWLLAPLLWIHITCMTFWMGSMIFATIFGGQQRIQAALENDERTRHWSPGCTPSTRWRSSSA